MNAKVQPIPEGYHSITPYLIIQGAAEAIEFYKKAFGAREILRVPMPDNRIGHAELQIGDSKIMLADEFPDMGIRSPKAWGGTPLTLMLYVEDVDAQAKQTVAAGAKVVREVQDQFYGDRSGHFQDPFGHEWTLWTHKEDLTPEEIAKRMKDPKFMADSKC